MNNLCFTKRLVTGLMTSSLFLSLVLGVFSADIAAVGSPNGGMSRKFTAVATLESNVLRDVISNEKNDASDKVGSMLKHSLYSPHTTAGIVTGLSDWTSHLESNSNKFTPVAHRISNWFAPDLVHTLGQIKRANEVGGEVVKGGSWFSLGVMGLTFGKGNLRLVTSDEWLMEVDKKPIEYRNLFRHKDYQRFLLELEEALDDSDEKDINEKIVEQFTEERYKQLDKISLTHVKIDIPKTIITENAEESKEDQEKKNRQKIKEDAKTAIRKRLMEDKNLRETLAKARYQKIMMAIGGNEALNILSHDIIEGWMENGMRMKRSDMALYIKNAVSPLAYSFKNDWRKGFNDYKAYAYNINRVYGYDKEENKQYEIGEISLGQLRFIPHLFCDLVDPYMWFAACNIIHDMGRETHSKSDITIPTVVTKGPFRYYLPRMHLQFTPYGFEYATYHYFGVGRATMALELGWGNHGIEGKRKTSKYIGLDIPLIKISEKFELGARARIWSQPDIGPDNEKHDYNEVDYATGGSVMIKGVYNVDDALAILVEGGYKTKGYMPGDPMTSQIIVRTGIRYTFS